MDHDPQMQHNCTLGWRTVAAAVDTHLDWHASLVSNILSAVSTAILGHRTQLEEQFVRDHAFRLRFSYRIDSWHALVFNFPETAPPSWRLFSCDAKQVFDNVPHDTEDGLRTTIPAAIREAFEFREGCNLYVPVDAADDLVGRARFARGPPPPEASHRKTARYIQIDCALAIAIVLAYLDVLYVKVGDCMSRMIHGIPTGGSPCSYFLDLHLDFYEYGWACRVAALVLIDPRQAQALATAMLNFFRYADDTCGIVPPWFMSLFNPETPRDPHCTNWIYPLRNAEGETILEFEIENALTLSIDFLCVTISMEIYKAEAEAWIRLQPYNKTDKFNFEFPRFTHWYSNTPRSVKGSVYKSMLQYALLCSTSTQAIIQYVEKLTRVLQWNKYPRNFVQCMWREAEEALFSIPVKDYITNEDLHYIHRHITDFIPKLYRGRDQKRKQ